MHKLSTSYQQPVYKCLYNQEKKLSKKIIFWTSYFISIFFAVLICLSTVFGQAESLTNSLQDDLLNFKESNSDLLNLDKENSLDEEFNPSIILKNEDFFALPEKFNSAFAIQHYLEEKGSLLANYWVTIDFVGDEGVLKKYNNPNWELQPDTVLKPFIGEKMLFSELIWRLSRDSLASGCSLVDNSICFDNLKQPFNPAFLLAKIQKESGLIYGKNSKLDPKDSKTEFLLDRIAGYYCVEISDPSEKVKSCFDENPEWKYYKGVFRQLFYTTRFIRIMMQRCEIGETKANRGLGNVYYVGNKIKVNDQEIFLANSFTCASYIYTPHISAQKILFKIYRQIMINEV